MRIGLLLVFSLFSSALMATPVFPGATVFESSPLTDGRFSLALGGMEKQNGVWHPEKSLKVSVSGTRNTYEIGLDVSVAEVFDFYSNAYKPSVIKQLFSCEALDCGSSAQWANGYFGVRELYGPDREQRLSVWLIEEGAQQKLVTLYVMQRGNRKVYAHLDTFDLVEPLQVATPRIQALGTIFDLNSVRSDELRDLARKIRDEQNLGHLIWVVGHAYSDADVTVNESNALTLAQALHDKLALLGLQALNVRAVGMLAPQGESAVDRVVVLASQPK